MTNATLKKILEIRSGIMKKTLHILTASFIMLTFFVGNQIAGAQEWKFLTTPQHISSQTPLDNDQKIPSQKENLSELRLPSDKGLLDSSSTQNRTQWDRTQNPLEHSSQGSWAPLPSPPGNENFTLLSF